MIELNRMNLLDWRGAERQTRRRGFFRLLVLSAIFAVVAGGVAPTVFYGRQIDTQQSRNDFLRRHIKSVEAELGRVNTLDDKRSRLIERMQIIEDLQRSRASVVHYVDQMVATVPKGVRLTHVKEQGNRSVIHGEAVSNGRLSEYMLDLDASPWFDNPELKVITRDDDTPQGLSAFELSVTNTEPSASESDDNHGASE